MNIKTKHNIDDRVYGCWNNMAMGPFKIFEINIFYNKSSGLSVEYTLEMSYGTFVANQEILFKNRALALKHLQQTL